VHRNHCRPESSTPAESKPVPYKLKSDHIGTCTDVKPYKRDPNKYDALSRTDGWAPGSANTSGAQRAVYDPVSHKTTLYTFEGSGSVGRLEGKGDGMMREKALKDKQTGATWHGRRKGVVEFVDRTHFNAVNANTAHRSTCAKNPHAFHMETGEDTKWMDAAFSSKMKVPFYGKTPNEMSR
jgi:hypothetical protein